MNNLMKILETIVSSLKIYIDKVDRNVDEKINEINKQIPTENDAVMLVAELGFVEPVMNDGFVLTGKDGTIYTF